MASHKGQNYLQNIYNKNTQQNKEFQSAVTMSYSMRLLVSLKRWKKIYLVLLLP